jgi:group I intron endonuclease
MTTFTVYRHTSPIGKVYIGITCQPLEKRWAKGAGYKHSPHFLAAIEKYGWLGFTHDILATGLSKEEAEQMEIDLIAQYKSTDPRFGYNTDRGGSTGPKHTPETKAKIGEANRTREWKPESKEKLRAYRKAHPIKPETAKKIGEANRGRKHRAESIERIRKAQPKRAVVNLDTGAKYASVMEASRALRISPSHIVKACKGKRRVAGGFRWCYGEEVIS